MKVVNGVLIAPEWTVGPSITAAAITPSDTVPLPDYARGIYVGGLGDVTVVMAGDTTGTPVTFRAVPVGTVLNIVPLLVKATGTTAMNLVALF